MMDFSILYGNVSVANLFELFRNVLSFIGDLNVFVVGILFILWYLFKVLKLNIIFASNLKRKIYFVDLDANADKNSNIDTKDSYKKKDYFSEGDFQYLKDYLENIGLKKLGRFGRIFNVHPEIIKYYKMDLIDKNSILVINFNPYVEVEKYKEIFDYAQENNIFVFIYAKSGAILPEYWGLIGKYSIIDVVNTPIRLVNMMLSVMKIKS